MPLIYEPADLGKLKREYDDWDNNCDPKLINDLLQVIPVSMSELNQTADQSTEARGAQSEQKKPIKKSHQIRDAILAHQRIASRQEVISLKEAPEAAFILDRLARVLEDAYFSLYDLLARRRIKTSLTVLGGIGAGAAIGAVVGTFILPGIGTAAGGAVGSAISSGLAAVGGALGVSILGAFVGSWFGKKAADKAFKNEKRFQLSRRVTRKVKERLGVDNDTIDYMNGYLYNRKISVKNDDLRNAYKQLRKQAIKKADPDSMETLGYFFAKELELLIMERGKGNISEEAFNQEAAPLITIIQALKKSKLSQECKQTLSDMEEIYNTVDAEDKKARMPKPKHNDSAEDKITRKRQRSMILSGGHDQSANLPTKLVQAPARLTDMDSEKQDAEILKVVEEIHRMADGETGRYIKVHAGDDRELAVKYCAAVMQIGQKPQLDRDVFDGPTRIAIRKEARALVKQGYLEEAATLTSSKNTKPLAAANK